MVVTMHAPNRGFDLREVAADLRVSILDHTTTRQDLDDGGEDLACIALINCASRLINDLLRDLLLAIT